MKIRVYRFVVAYEDSIDGDSEIDPVLDTAIAELNGLMAHADWLGIDKIDVEYQDLTPKDWEENELVQAWYDRAGKEVAKRLPVEFAPVDEKEDLRTRQAKRSWAMIHDLFCSLSEENLLEQHRLSKKK